MFHIRAAKIRDMSNFSPASDAPATAHPEPWVTCQLRVLRCRDAASKAHDPDFQRIWLQHAEDIRINHRKGLH